MHMRLPQRVCRVCGGGKHRGGEERVVGRHARHRVVLWQRVPSSSVHGALLTKHRFFFWRAVRGGVWQRRWPSRRR